MTRDAASPASFPRFLDPQVSSANATALNVSRDRISHYFNSYGNRVVQPAMPVRRKLSGTMRGTMLEGEGELRRRG